MSSPLNCTVHSLFVLPVCTNFLLGTLGFLIQQIKNYDCLTSLGRATEKKGGFRTILFQSHFKATVMLISRAHSDISGPFHSCSLSVFLSLHISQHTKCMRFVTLRDEPMTQKDLVSFKQKTGEK